MTEAQERIWRAGGGFVFGRDVQERLGGVATTLPLKHAFAKPVVGVGGTPVAGVHVTRGFFDVYRLCHFCAMNCAPAVRVGQGGQSLRLP